MILDNPIHLPMFFFLSFNIFQVHVIRTICKNKTSTDMQSVCKRIFQMGKPRLFFKIVREGADIHFNMKYLCLSFT